MVGRKIIKTGYFWWPAKSLYSALLRRSYVKVYAAWSAKKLADF
jgi:hypothetical protein